jgi:ubiquinone/menaquinone biosynthesis C-methylase UbiE
MSTNQIPDTEQFKEQVRQQFTRRVVADRKWKSQEEIQGRAATQMLLRAARVKPGMHLLDLASGAGDPALTLTEVVGPSGYVTATDLVPDRLAVAEECARERGLANITFQQADAEALPFPDQAFDVVTCRLGVMLFPDVQQALGEIRRVLKPGGRAAFVAWGPAEQKLDMRIPQDILKKYVQVPPPEPGAPSAYRFGQAGTLSAELRDAGFRQVNEDSPTVPYPWPGPPEEYWEHSREFSPNIRRLVERLAPEQREQVDAEVIEAIRQYYDGRQVNFTATIVVASGVR